MNVDFYDKKISLYINGIPCGRRRITVLERCTPENGMRHYKRPIGEDARSVLTGTFSFRYDTTLLRHRPYYKPYFCLLKGADKLFKYDRLYEDDIDDIILFIEYEPCGQSVSMKELLRYPADLVIDYLKERGITSCPLATG